MAKKCTTTRTTPLAQLRVRHGMTHRDLAAALGYSENTIEGWEAEPLSIKMRAAWDAADYFGVSIDYLVGRDDA